MRKRIGLMLCMALLVCSFALAGCGGGGSEDLSDSKYVGTWKCTGMELKDESEELDYDYTLTLNADGTGQFAGGGESSDITWSLTDDGFKTKGDAKLTFRDDGDRIRAKVIGVDLVFEKQ